MEEACVSGFKGSSRAYPVSNYSVLALQRAEESGLLSDSAVTDESSQNLGTNCLGNL